MLERICLQLVLVRLHAFVCRASCLVKNHLNYFLRRYLVEDAITAYHDKVEIFDYIYYVNLWLSDDASRVASVFLHFSDAVSKRP